MDALYSILTDFNVLVILLVTLCFTFYWYFTVPSNIPPGPLGLPVLGSLPLLITTNPGKRFSELAEKYGSVFSLYVGNRLVIVLNSYEAIKEAFIKQGDVFSGRPPNLSFNFSEPERYNIVTADGAIWRDHRHFALNAFKELGVGKLSIEPKIMDEIQHCLIELKKYDGKEADFRELVCLSVSNVICILLLGKRCDYNDPWFLSAKNYTDKMVAVSSSLSICQFLPWLRHVPGIASLMKQKSFVQTLNKFKESLYSIIDEKKKRHINGQGDNYTSAFIEEQNERKEKGNYDETFSDEALEQNTRILIVAGSETTCNTLLWGILLMMKHPEVQQKVQQEIDQVYGSDHLPSMNQKYRTPYTEATIQEIQRVTTLVPLNVPHRNTEECEVLGHKIPKDSYVVSNLWAVHNDPKLWEDPEVFRPERFLNDKGEVIRSEHLISFSIGKRQCLGIELARMELYLFFTSVLQKFTFETPEGTVTSLEPRLSITNTPKYFKARAIPKTSAWKLKKIPSRILFRICMLSKYLFFLL